MIEIIVISGKVEVELPCGFGRGYMPEFVALGFAVARFIKLPDSKWGVTCTQGQYDALKTCICCTIEE